MAGAMAFRVAHFNILGRHMAGTMWFHYAKDFLPRPLATACVDWYREAGFPRSLMWRPSDGPSRFYRFPVLLDEIRALRADILCLVELDCFQEFNDALGAEGYDAVFHARPGKADGCGIFWRREIFEAAAPSASVAYSMPANDRVAAAQALRHRATSRSLLVVSTHLHWDKQAGHQLSEAEELLSFAGKAAKDAGVADGATVVCADLNALPGSGAYRLLRNRLGDAALEDGVEGHADGAFTSMKPDVYYFAWPRGARNKPEAREEWHLQEGRREVIDYVLYDAATLEVEAPAVLPCLNDEPAQKRRRGAGGKETPFGFWAGSWDFVDSPAPGYEEGRYDPNWTPARAHGQLQLGIPNRLHGSDHVPVACTLRWREGNEDAKS